MSKKKSSAAKLYGNRQLAAAVRRELLPLTNLDAKGQALCQRLFPVLGADSVGRLSNSVCDLLTSIKASNDGKKVELARDDAKRIALVTVSLLPLQFHASPRDGVYNAAALYGMTFGHLVPWMQFDKVSRERLSKDIASVLFTLDRKNLRPSTAEGNFISVKHVMTEGVTAETLSTFRIKAKSVQVPAATPAEPLRELIAQERHDLEQERRDREVSSAQDAAAECAQPEETTQD